MKRKNRCGPQRKCERARMAAVETVAGLERGFGLEVVYYSLSVLLLTGSGFIYL